ncbi:MAG: ADP-dependent NAD(P)H-hydrate dehydratase [Humibacter sp.]
MTNETSVRRWGSGEASEWLAAPHDGDDKYTRGVLGVLTGSDEYPGAAVLGVEAAVRTGVGMVRYLGDDIPARLVLQRRPETVAANGRVQAWLLGSGMDAAHRDTANEERLRVALAQNVPAVIDAGALDLIGDATGPVVITPHFRELSRVLAAYGVTASPEQIADDAPHWARESARLTGATVLLKGHATHVASPAGEVLVAAEGTNWLATAGSGDVLGGVLGALVATHADKVATGGHDVLATLAATAAVVHGLAGSAASDAVRGGPIAALDVAEALPGVVGALLASR